MGTGDREMTYAELLIAATNYPRLLGWAGRFVGELARTGKLTPQGVEDLLGGVQALVKIARHPTMTTARLATVARMLANTLQQHNGEYILQGLFSAVERCGTEGADGAAGGEQLPCTLQDAHLVDILVWMQTHRGLDNEAFWQMIATHIREEGNLPHIETSYLG